MHKTVVFIGDSLTQWFDWQQRFPEHRVINLGKSGETVEGLLARRKIIRSSIDNPDYIFLMTGINNIVDGQYDIIIPYNEIVRNLTTWYKNALVIVQSILPAATGWISNNAIMEANRKLAQIAHAHRVEYLDLYSLFVDADGSPKPGYLSDDGVHLAGKGYEVWSKEVERLLKK